jgi:hypothetical protein
VLTQALSTVARRPHSRILPSHSATHARNRGTGIAKPAPCAHPAAAGPGAPSPALTRPRSGYHAPAVLVSWLCQARQPELEQKIPLQATAWPADSGLAAVLLAARVLKAPSTGKVVLVQSVEVYRDMRMFGPSVATTGLHFLVVGTAF